MFITGTRDLPPESSSTGSALALLARAGRTPAAEAP
jgi:hypothetical protein